MSSTSITAHLLSARKVLVLRSCIGHVVDGKHLRRQHLANGVEQSIECGVVAALVRGEIAVYGIGGASDDTITGTFDDPVFPGYDTHARQWRVVELGSRQLRVNRTALAMACSICWRRI